jgi:membrane protease subunit HflC
MNKSLLIILILLAAALIVIGGTVFTVDQTQSAVVLQLGKPVIVHETPGLKFKIPFAQQVTFFDNRLLDYDAAPEEIVTKDKKTLVVDNFAKWRIVDPLKFYQALRSERQAQSRLDDIIFAEVRVSLGTHTLIEIVNELRSELMTSITARCNETAMRDYGIEIRDVRIKRADLPPENERAVYARMTAEREREAKRYRSEGEEEAQKIRATAEKERTIVLAEAYRQSEELRGNGDAEAAAIYAAAYGRDEEFYRFTRSLEAYRRSIKAGTTLVLTPDSEFLKYLRRSR